MRLRRSERVRGGGGERERAEIREQIENRVGRAEQRERTERVVRMRERERAESGHVDRVEWSRVCVCV